MNILLPSLLGLSALSVIYGIIRVVFLSREYRYRRRVFEHHLNGRKIERRDRERRSTSYLEYT